MPCTVSKLWLVIGQIFASDRGKLHFNVLARSDPCEYPDKLYLPRNYTMILLPDAEDRTIVYLLIWTKHRNETDRRTNGQTDRQPVLLQRCKNHSI